MLTLLRPRRATAETLSDPDVALAAGPGSAVADAAHGRPVLFAAAPRSCPVPGVAGGVPTVGGASTRDGRESAAGGAPAAAGWPDDGTDGVPGLCFGFAGDAVADPGLADRVRDEWRTGKGWTRAWLDAAARGSSLQVPVVVATGADRRDARDRLTGARLLGERAGGAGWRQWLWDAPAGDAGAWAPRNVALPTEALVAELEPIDLSWGRAVDIVARHHLAVRLPWIEARAFSARDGAVRMALRADGGYDLDLARPDERAAPPLPLAQALARAQDVVFAAGLDRDAPVAIDHVIRTWTAGAGADGTREAPRVLETTVQLRQRIAGLPVIGSGGGLVRISVDNAGTVTRVHAGVRPVAALRPARAATPCQAEGAPAGVLAGGGAGATSGRPGLGVPEGVEVGYVVRGDVAWPVIRREVAAADGAVGLRAVHVTPVVD